jgi:hypothetical protein
MNPKPALWALALGLATCTGEVAKPGANHLEGNFSFQVHGASASAGITQTGGIDLSFIDVQLGSVDLAQFCSDGTADPFTSASISVDQSATGSPIQPGTYDLSATQPIARVLITRIGSAPEPEFLAESEGGSVTLEQVDAGRIRGHFQAEMLHMITGERAPLTGSFDATYCN